MHYKAGLLDPTQQSGVYREIAVTRMSSVWVVPSADPKTIDYSKGNTLKFWPVCLFSCLFTLIVVFVIYCFVLPMWRIKIYIREGIENVDFGVLKRNKIGPRLLLRNSVHRGCTNYRIGH